MPRTWIAFACIVLCPWTSTAIAQSLSLPEHPIGSSDDRPHPLGEQRRALQARAVEAQVRGIDPVRPGPYQLPPGQFVELERVGEGRIWTVLAEFGDEISPRHGGEPGPRHNQIPEPDRTRDNATIWTPDFDRDYFLDLLFDDGPGAVSLRTFYIEQSSGRYAVQGDVTDWVQVPFNTAHYGNEGSSTVALFIEHAVEAWYADQLAAGRTAEEIDDYLAWFDVRDRYDNDRDGVFDEPDGYIDHFQIVHAGDGEEAGGGTYGEDAIWSHRAYARPGGRGTSGPSEDYLLGGVQIGDSAFWVGDYTTEPENGGVGIFAHEFGHDLGLPHPDDSYWSVMARGSWLGDGVEDIGSRPCHMTALAKLQLGWLDYEVAFAEEESEHRLGPSMTTTRQSQAIIVPLPDKPVPPELGPPYSGEGFYWSGPAGRRQTAMFRPLTLPAGASLSAKVRYDLQEDFDYAYVTVSFDGFSFWIVPTNLSTDLDPNGLNIASGITGSTGGAWLDLTADLSGFEGEVWLGFFVLSDEDTWLDGLFLDDIAVTGQALDDAESDLGWHFRGFRWLRPSFHAYLAEYRQYRGYDETLETGPYVHLALDPQAGIAWVEHFPYQQGLVITYWDTSQPRWDDDPDREDGRGLMLPVDAHPDPVTAGTFIIPSWPIQAYDIPFGLEPTDPWLIPESFGLEPYPSQPAVPVFDDTLDYWRAESPWSARHPHTGTRIQVQSVSETGFMQVRVGRSD